MTDTDKNDDTAAIAKSIAEALASGLPQKLKDFVEQTLPLQYCNLTDNGLNWPFILHAKPIEKYIDNYLMASLEEYAKQFQDDIETVLNAVLLEFTKEQEKKLSELDLTGKGATK